MTTRCLAVTSGGSVGGCSRLSQPSWLWAHCNIVTLAYLLSTHFYVWWRVCYVIRRPEAIRLSSHSDTVLGLVPYHHVFGLLVNLCTSLLQGCTVVNVPGFDKTHLLHAMDIHHVRLIFASAKYKPFHFHIFSDCGQNESTKVQSVQRYTGLTRQFYYFLTFRHSGAQSWAPECPNAKKLKMIG